MVSNIKFGNTSKIFTIIYDITKQKKAEKDLVNSREEIRQSQQHLLMAQNAANIGTWEWKIKTDELIWSEKSYEIFGFPKAKKTITSEDFFSKVHPDDKKRLLQEFNTHLSKKTKTIIQSEYRIIPKENKVEWIYEMSELLYAKNGEFVHQIGTMQNITARKEAEIAVQKSEEKLKEANATKDKFFSIIAHDLKSPFNSLLGFSQLLSNNFEDYDLEDQKKLIGHIDQSANNTYKLLENLLDWSRSQREVIDFKPEIENLFLIVEQTLSLLVQQASNKSIKIENKISGELLIVADKNMLSTIIRNLVSNAIKFTPKEGRICIRATKISDVKSKKIEISVTDNGQGMSTEVQSKLFKITESISTLGTEQEKGTGLGLILCKEFVEKHGGEIWVESEIGKGSAFYFNIPVKV